MYEWVQSIGAEYTVDENIIATTKIRNNYGAIQSFIFPISIQKISHEPIYKTPTKIETNILRATTFAIANFEDR